MEIKGSLLTGADDFTGLAGFEVLENYDPALLKNNKKSVSFYKNNAIRNNLLLFVEILGE